MDHETALSIAKEVSALFADVAEAIHICGSVRRLVDKDIKDVDLVIVPKLEPVQADLFGGQVAEVSRQLPRAQQLLAEGVIRQRLDQNGFPHFGERSQRIIYKDVAVDLFVALPPAQLGIKLILATGPKSFTKRLVTQRAEGGRILQVGQVIRDGALYEFGKLVETPTEESVFKYLGLPFYPPERRQ